MAKNAGGVRNIYGKIMSIISDIATNGYSKQSPFSVGPVESDLSEYAKRHGIDIGNGQLYMSASQIAHTLRDIHSNKGIDVTPQQLATFPEMRSSMSLYHDSNGDKFVYYDGSVKYVVHPNYSLKLPSGKARVVNFITAYKSNGSEFNKQNFTKIR